MEVERHDKSDEFLFAVLLAKSSYTLAKDEAKRGWYSPKAPKKEHILYPF